MPQRQGDWAERKVAAIFKRNGGLLSGDDLVRLLRAERARAVRKCNNIRGKLGYTQACDDCANAIGGKKA